MITEAELEAYTSAGLIRRARKALAIETPEITHHEANSLGFMFEGYTGTLSLMALVQSQCNCPATGLCKHIVAVALVEIAGRKQKVAAYRAPDFSADKLAAVRNKTAWRSAYKYFTRSDEITSAEVSLQEDHCTVRWDDHVAVIGKSNEVNEIVFQQNGSESLKLLAALIYQRAKNENITWPEWLLVESTSIEREKWASSLTLKKQVRDGLCKLIQRGLVNIGKADLVELNSAIPRLRSVGQDHIANVITSLNERVLSKKKGIGHGHEFAILRLFGLLYARCDSSLETNKYDDAGYQPVKYLCLGGHRWETDSKVHGLSMVLISEQGKMLSTDIVRPSHVPGFSPSIAWNTGQLWEGAPLNAKLTGRVFEVDKDKFNQWGSLTIDSGSIISEVPSEPFSVKPVRDWLQLKKVEEYGYAILAPKQWISCGFDEHQQVLRLIVEDDNGRSLFITQAYTTSVSQRIAAISMLWAKKPEYIVVKHRVSFSHHIFEPVLIYNGEWISPDFELLDEKKAGLLERLASKWTNKADAYTHTTNDTFVNMLGKLTDLLIEFPHFDASQANALSLQFHSMGLQFIAEKISAMEVDASEALQLSYIAERLAYHTAAWPIVENME